MTRGTRTSIRDVFPVQVESPHGYIVYGSVVRFRFVMRTLTFEYLPRTAANLALTDIRAQHPER